VRTLPRGWYVLNLEHGTLTLWDGPYITPIACVDALGGYVHEYPGRAFTCRGTRGAPNPAARKGGSIWTETLLDVRDRAGATRECCEH